MTAGVVGTFMLLRKRALVGDVIGHSALPGIATAFLVMEMIAPGTGKSLPGLLTGAFLSGLAGAVCVMLIDGYTRIKSDAAMAVVLSVFYGLGAALFTVVQRVPSGNAAGLKYFLNGKAASLLAGDIWLFIGAALLVATTLLMLKELTILCFDDEFAAASGWPVFWMDTLLICLVVAVIIIGMQSVGLILVVATLITPPAAARFWTDDIGRMTFIAGGLGAAGSLIGAVISALFPRIATGAVIVLAGAAPFAISLCFGIRRGIVLHSWRQYRARQEIGRHDLLRAIYEFMEGATGQTPTPSQMADTRFRIDDLLPLRHWNAATVTRLIEAARRDGLLLADGRQWQLTPAGVAASRQTAQSPPVGDVPHALCRHRP